MNKSKNTGCSCGARFIRWLVDEQMAHAERQAKYAKIPGKEKEYIRSKAKQDQLKRVIAMYRQFENQCYTIQPKGSFFGDLWKILRGLFR